MGDVYKLYVAKNISELNLIRSGTDVGEMTRSGRQNLMVAAKDPN